MALYDGEERTGTGAGAVRTSSTSHRRIGSVWSLKRVAVAATRGLFGAPPTSSTPDDDVSLQGVDESRLQSDWPASFKMVHKSTTSPSLDPFPRARPLHPPHPQDEAINPRRPTLSFASPRPRTLTSVGRPVISSPSHPLHLNGAATLNSKLSYPIMSPTLPSVSSPSIPPSTPRRRTKSAPGCKLPSNSKPVALRDYPASPTEFGVDLPPPFFHSSGVSPDYPTTFASPVQSSPRSISSVKRKPVPRHSIRLESSLDALGSGPTSSSPFLFQRRRLDALDSDVPPRTASLASSASTPPDDALLPFNNTLKCPQTPSDCGRSSQQQIQALSPLTVEEMDAIQCFARENEGTYHDTRRRRRRRDLRPRTRLLRESSYHMHTAIVDSYFDGSDEDLQPSSDASILDGPIELSSSSRGDGAGSGSRSEELLDGSVPPLRVNRATFGVYDTPTHSPSTARNDTWDANEGDVSVLEDVVNDVNTTMEIFRHSVSGSCDSFEGTCGATPDVNRMARRGGLHARDENLVSHIVSSTRPALALQSSPDLLECRVEGRVPLRPFDDARAFRRDDDHETTTSSSSYSTPDIGVAIMSREDIARFESEVENEERYLVSAFSCSSESDHGDIEDEDEESLDACDGQTASSFTPYEPLVSPLTEEMPTTPSPDFELADLSTSYDRLQSSLSKLRATHSPSLRDTTSFLGSSTSSSSTTMSKLSLSKSSLKPALRINSGFHSISTASSPSPPTPCSSLPPLSPGFILPGNDWATVGMSDSGSSRGSMSPRSPTFSNFPSSRALHAQAKGPNNNSTSSSYQYHYGTPPVPSFIHLTPNEPAEKKQLARGRLRKLFSRSSGAKK